MILRFLILFITFSLIGCNNTNVPNNMEKTVKFSIIEYGVYDSVSKITALNAPILQKKTSDINAKLGVRFGVKVAAEADGVWGDTVPVKVRVSHPAITNPYTNVIAKTTEWDAHLQFGFPRFSGWAFENTYELVPGIWKIQIISDEIILAEQVFNIAIAEGG